MSYWQMYGPYVSVARKKSKAEKTLKRLRKNNPNIKPVTINGRAIARTWWGKSWNKNLESYADYSNRIGRGRSYVRHNGVLDLQIKSGLIESLVQGTRSIPYKVKVEIKAIKKSIWNDLQKASQGEFESLQELFEGKLPESLSEIFTDKKTGLFPSPEEISFDCSCPDWAGMCKHVAATLYGIGARLDVEPELFFTLRNVNMKDLITGAIKEKAGDLLKRAKKKTSKVIDDADISEIFGIDIDIDTISNKQSKKKTVNKALKKITKKVQSAKKSSSKKKKNKKNTTPAKKKLKKLSKKVKKKKQL